MSWKNNFVKSKNNIIFLGKFVFNFGPSVTAFFPIFAKLVNYGEFGEFEKSTFIYLSVAVISLLIDIPKDDLKSRNVFIILSNSIHRVFNTIVDIFSYTALLVPFAISLLMITENDITLNNILDSFLLNIKWKLLCTFFGLLCFVLKDIIIKLVTDAYKIYEKG